MLGAVLALSIGACTPRHPLPEGYALHATAPFGAAAHLEILEDGRLTDSTRQLVATWEPGEKCGDREPGLPPSFCTSLVPAPLRPAILRVVTSADSEMGRLTLERPVANFREIGFGPGHDSLLGVEVDLTADIGSYSGPLVRLPVLTDGTFGWTRTVAAPGDSGAEVDLYTTGKAAWKPDSAADRPTFLLVSCHPDFDRPAKANGDLPFVVDYIRIFRDNAGWHQVSRTRPGFWEDDDFPPRTAFP